MASSGQLRAMACAVMMATTARLWPLELNLDLILESPSIPTVSFTSRNTIVFVVSCPAAASRLLQDPPIPIFWAMEARQLQLRFGNRNRSQSALPEPYTSRILETGVCAKWPAASSIPLPATARLEFPVMAGRLRRPRSTDRTDSPSIPITAIFTIPTSAAIAFAKSMGVVSSRQWRDAAGDSLVMAVQPRKHCSIRRRTSHLTRPTISTLQTRTMDASDALVLMGSSKPSPAAAVRPGQSAMEFQQHLQTSY